MLERGDKDQIMELVRDRVLTPRNYDGIQFYNYYTKAAWSEVTFKEAPLRTPRCLLATLTSTFQLVIHGQLNEFGEDRQRNWTQLLNVSQTTNMILRERWEQEDAGVTSGLDFEEYKSRLRELTCVDFAWMTPLGMSSTYDLFLIVAHVNGGIDIWRIFPCAETGIVAGEILLSSIVAEGEVISAMKFHALDEKLGLLTIGTNSGIVRVFRIHQEFEHPLETVPGESISPNGKISFKISDGTELCEKDELRIESFLLTTATAKDQKRHSVHVVFHKHPSYLCSTTITAFGDGVIWKPIQYLKAANGPMVGFGRYSSELLMCLHEAGILSLVYHKGDHLKYIEGSANSIKEVPKGKVDIYRYNGIAFSANNGLAFIGKNLQCFYDHNVDKDPGRLIVFSTMAVNDAWDSVKNHYRANGCRLEPISDILLSFRYHLRSHQEHNVDKFLDGSGPLDIAPDLLKLYYWTLRALNLLDDHDIREDREKIKAIEAVHQRQLEVEDELIQRHCIALLESVDATSLSTLTLEESQSLFLVQQYLNSKPNLRHLTFEPAIIPTEAPKCVICDNEVDFVEEIQDGDADPLENLDSEQGMDGRISRGKVAGFEWCNLQCSEKHSFPVCILSLRPCNFPYRKCDLCGVVATLKPIFNMKQECPLCGGDLKESEGFEEIDEGDDSDIEDPPGIRFLGMKSEAVGSPP